MSPEPQHGIRSIVFLPQAPVIVADVAAGAAPELDGLRAACTRAIRELAAGTDNVAVVGTPQSLPVAAYLLRNAGVSEAREFPIAADATPERCTDLGVSLSVSLPGPTLLAVMGDGSASRSEKAPGYLDARAEPLDRAIEAAFAAADPDFFTQLDPALCDELLVAGRAAWQVAAAAAKSKRPWMSGPVHAEDPYGVRYYVAQWRRRISD